ncbi:MAG: choice-of-anchor D domain-containing protein [Bacteroidales bacterium]|nr:choice-of-anchor D domain-containing protein [Bacteroidales bacterium]
MKNLFTLVLFLLITSVTLAEGWRKGEMEIRAFPQNETQVSALLELRFNGDYYDDKAVLYLVPAELDKLKAAGIPYEITIPDLNVHYQDFWLGEDAYHTYDQIIALADSLATHFPNICSKHLYGTSVGGRQLAALKISDNVSTDENEAEVLFDGGIHGDEIGASENVIRFARDLCLAYGSDPTITNLINNREVWLYLMVNPDGRVNMSRYNNNGVDLNRDAGYMWDAWGGSPGPFSQVESRALRSWMLDHQAVIHITYHSGTEEISYPWSYRPDVAPDQPHIHTIAGIYSNNSGYSSLPYHQGYSGMYPINGSTKDCNYGIMGTVSFTMEISYSKQPPTSQIMMYYNYNKPSMIKMIEYGGYGVSGTVTDATTGLPVAALIYVGSNYPVFSDPVVGDYHKFLNPGTYNLRVVANGYQTQMVNGVVVTSMNNTIANVQLQPLQGHYGYRISSSQIPDNNHSDEGYTPAATGAPDDINYSIGKNGWVVVDMQNPIQDTPGNDFKVHEGDVSPEGYTCFASNDIDGPWISLGTATGTAEFDLANGSLIEAQYIRILDDGDGTAVIADAGYDLDAIEAFEPIPGPYLVVYDTQIDDAMGNNNGRLDPGETANLIVTLRNNGDQPASNTSGVLSTLSSYITMITGNANFGTIQPGMTGTGTFTFSVDAGTPIGHVAGFNLDVTANSGAYTASFNLNFTVGLIVENFETGNFSAFPWQFSGSANWTITNVAPYEGIYCARSGVIGNNATTTMYLTVNVLAAGQLSFARKVSSEAGYDFLEFYIDGALQNKWAGTVAWSEVSFPVGTGNHTFTWTYMKDANTVGGSDCAWVDYIIFPPLAPPAPAISVSPLSLDYGGVFVGDQLTKTFIISNTGSALLSGNITTPACYTVNLADNTLSYSVNPGSSKTFNLTFAPMAIQGYNGDVVITHNATGGNVIITVTGSGISGFALPYEQDFEEGGQMPYAWINATGDDFDWTVDAGGTPSSGTGPSGDHTTGTGYYVYTESSSPNYPNKTANLISPMFDLAGMTSIEMKFWYHMYGTAMGSLHVDIYTNSTWINDIMPAISGNQGNAWYQKTVDLNAYLGQTIKIRFRGITGTNYTSDMAIDDFWIGGESGIAVIGISPSSISYILPPNSGQDETVTVTNTGTGSLSYSTSIAYQSGSNWLSITSNATGVVPPAGGTLDMVVHANSTGMVPGLYQAEITVTSNDPVNPQVIIPVSLELGGVAILDITVNLEGPFTGMFMANYLNNLGYVPLSQPYNNPPWNYNGTESVAAIPNSDVIDWVLVELRETTGSAATATADSIIARQAAFVMQFGDVVSLDGSSPLTFALDITDNLYVVIWHRNHLGIMSGAPLTLSGGVYLWDFTDNSSKAFGGTNSLKELATGVWGMIGGDGNGDRQISTGDKMDVWVVQSGMSGYLNGDFDMNGQVNNGDKIDIWGPNAGRGCQVP